MGLTLDEVEYVAALARLGLTSEEKERMREQLSSILDNIAILNEIDTDTIPPTATVLDLVNVMRPDEAMPSLTRDQVLMNAPRQRDGFFEVDSPLGGGQESA